MVLLVLLSLAIPVTARLIVSELYRDPPGTVGSLGGDASHEFVELTNLGADSVVIDSLYITNGLEADSIVPISEILPGHEQCSYAARTIAPGATALLLDPDYRKAIAADASRRFPLPAATVLLQCGDGEFGSNGLAADHGVIVYRGTKSRIDSVLCSAVDPGSELQTPTAEKITLSEPVNREGYSLIAASVLSDRPVFDYCDGALSPGWYEPIRSGWLVEVYPEEFDRAAGAVRCSVSVLSAAQPFSGPLNWQLESSRDGKQRIVSTGAIALSDDRGAMGIMVPVDSAELRFFLLVNNRPSWSIDLSAVWLPSTSLRITEIFPKATSGEPEWFEIMNCASMPINLKNWHFGNSEDTAIVTEVGKRLDPGAFAVITKDSAALASRYLGLHNIVQPPYWHTLDNTRDTIMLFDAAANVRETVCYDDQWFSSWPYLSLERNDNDDGCSPSSWTVAERATPQQPNGALYWRSAGAPSLDIGPVPFTPDNDGDDDLLAIRLALPAAASVTIDIYGFDGRVVKRFSGMPSPVCYWNGRGDAGAAPPGPFFVVAEIVQGGKVQRIRKKGVLWRK